MEDGLPLAGFGFSLKAAKITKFDRYEPGLTLTRVFLIKSPPPHAADGPKLLDVTGSFPENVLGSPLIDAQGKIVAIYSKVARVQDASGMKDLHFAVVAGARLIGHMAARPRRQDLDNPFLSGRFFGIGATAMNSSEPATLQPSQPPVGIDLGTTFSVVAYLDDASRPVTIPNGVGRSAHAQRGVLSTTTT